MARTRRRESENFFALLRPHLSEKDMERVGTAYRFSKYGHRGQERDDGTQYFDHPRSVAIIIIQELKIYDWRIVVAALLHDIMEDSFLLSEKRIAINFGGRVARWVELLTKQPGVDYHRRLTECEIWEVLLIKLSDRLHNLRELGNCSVVKQQRQIAETIELYLPLADMLVELLPARKRPLGEYLREQITALCTEHD